jgi:hypothetical protein
LLFNIFLRLSLLPGFHAQVASDILPLVGGVCCCKIVNLFVNMAWEEIEMSLCRFVLGAAMVCAAKMIADEMEELRKLRLMEMKWLAIVGV